MESESIFRHPPEGGVASPEQIADRDSRDLALIESIVPEVVENVRGRVVKIEGEDDAPDEGEVHLDQ